MTREELLRALPGRVRGVWRAHRRLCLRLNDTDHRTSARLSSWGLQAPGQRASDLMCAGDRSVPPGVSRAGPTVARRLQYILATTLTGWEWSTLLYKRQKAKSRTTKRLVHVPDRFAWNNEQ